MAVLVYQAAEHVNAFDAPRSGQRSHCRHPGGHRNVEVDAAMRVCGVVVLDIPGDDTR
jgi:hypothetical protein